MNFNVTERMRRFVLAYNGDAADAARIAGYTGTPSYLESRGNELLQNPDIISAIKERSKQIASNISIIAKTEEIQGFWSDVMRNSDPYEKPEVDANGATIPPGNIPLQHRLSASEKLAKAQGMFIERVDINANISLVDMVEASYTVSDKQLEEARVIYMANRKRKKEFIEMKKDGDTYEADEEDVTDGLF